MQTPILRHAARRPQRTTSTFAVAGALLAMTLWAGAAHPAQAADPVAAKTPLPTVPHLDLQRYSGTWYEIARLPNMFQKRCASDVVARYGPLPDGRVSVLNRCLTADGQMVEANAVARRVVHPGEAEDVGRLEVRFAPAWLSWLPMVWGDYWVIELTDDYSTALVGTPNREYLWLLSRQPTLDATEVSRWLDKATALGFDTQAVTRTPRRP